MKNSRLMSVFTTLLLSVGLFSFIPSIQAEAAASCVGNTCTQTFAATGAVQTFTPSAVGVQIKVTLNGGAGGHGGGDAGGVGGNGIGGNRVSFDYTATSTSPLYLYIGYAGGSGTGGSGNGGGAAGGNPWTIYNGGRGGNAGNQGSSGGGGGGGAATLIATGDKTGVLAVAGGGGGGGGANINSNGTDGKPDTAAQAANTTGAQGQDWGGDGSGGGGGGGGATGGTGGTGSADGWNPGGQGGVTGRNLVPGVSMANANTGNGSITITWPNGPTATKIPSFADSTTAKVGQILVPASGTYIASAGTVTLSNPRWQISNDGTTWTDISPAVSGNYTIQAGDAGKYVRFAENATDSANTLTWASDPSLQVTAVPNFTAESPAGTAVNTTLSSVYAGYTFASSGYRNVFSISSGSLPAGITLNSSTGALSGTPTVSGTYKYKVKVTNEAGSDETVELTLVVGQAPVFSSDDSLLQSVNRVTNPIRVGSSFANFVFTTAAYPVATYELKTDSATIPTCGVAPNCAYSFESLSLPNGLSFDAATATLSGTPTKTGSYVFAIKATNSAGSAVDIIHMSIAKAAPNAFSLASDKNSVVVVQGSTVTATVTATGGDGNGAFSFSVDPASTAICSVAKASDNTATMTVLAAGNCVINGTKAADGAFASSKSSVTIAVNKALQTSPLVITAQVNPLNFGSQSWILGTGGNGTGVFSWAIDPTSTSNCLVGQLSGNNVYTNYTTAGTCIYQVTKAGDAYFLPQTTKWELPIGKANQSALTITNYGASNWNATAPVTYSLVTSGGTGTGAVTFALDPNSNNVCSISGTTLTARSAGTCTVIATKAADTNYTQQTSAALTWTINQISQPALTVAMTTSTGSALPFNGSTAYIANPTAVVTLNLSGGAGSGSYTYTATGNSNCVVQGAGPIAYVYAAPTGTGIGACYIAVTKSGDTNYTAASVNTQFSFTSSSQTALVATPANPSMDFIPSTLIDAGTAAKTQLTVTGGLGTGAVTYAVANTSTSVCSVDANGLVTDKTAGTCLINITKAADANYLVQTTTATVIFNKLNQAELLATTASAAEPFVWSPKATEQISTTGGSGTGAVSYAVDPSSSTVCSVNASTGLITDITAGICLVNVTKAADTNYSVVTDQVRVVFNKINPAAITLSASPASIAYTSAAVKNQTWVTVSGGANSTGASTFYVDPMTEENCSIATVQANRVLVNGNLAGLCLITVVQAADVNYNEIRTMIGFNITKMVQTIGATSSAGTSISYVESPGVLTTINVTGQSGTGMTRYVVDPTANTSNCSVDQETGKVTSATVGTCRITVSRDGDDNVAASNSVVLNLTVGKVNQSIITLTPAVGFKLASVGSTAATSALTLGLTNAGTGAFTKIVSTTPLICTITGGGDSTLTPPTFTASATPSIVVTAVNDGTCTLQYTKLGDANFNLATNFTASFAVPKAAQADLNVNFTAGSATMPFVNTPKATATLSTTGGNGNGVINYTVDPLSTSICSVNLTTGVVTDITAGVCLINVKRLTDNDYAESAVKVVTITFNKIDQAALVLSAAKTALKATTSALDTTTLSTTGGLGTGAVTYAVDPASSAICSISGTTVTALGAGDCNITATKAADVNYNITTAPIKLTVTKGAQATLASYWWNQPNLGTGTQANPTPFNPNTDQINYFVTSGGTGTGDLVFAIDPISAAVCASAKLRPSYPTQIIVTALGNGECKVSVYKSGGSAWDDSNTVTASFWIGRVNQATLTATSSKSSVAYFDAPANTFTVAVTGGSGTGATSISINPASAAICSDATVADGVITVKTLGVGNCLLTAVKAASPGYNQATSAQITVTITKGTQAPIVISASPSDLAYQVSPRATSQITVTGGSGNGALTITVDSGSTAICSFNANTNTITVLQAGKCELTASKAAGADGVFNAATGKLSITIQKVAQAKLTLTPVAPQLTFNDSPKASTVLNLAGGTGTGAVSYLLDPGSSSVCSLSVVNGTATITANYFGYCVVKATKAGDVNFADATATATVRIAQPGTQIIASVPSSTAKFIAAPGFVTTVTVEGSEDGDILSYSVDPSSKDICSVSGIGTTAQVISLAQGVCNVIAINVSRSQDGTLIASSSVASFTITKGDQLNVTVTPAAPKVYFATPAATDVITVAGGVSGSIITATVDPTSVANCSVTVAGDKVTMIALQVGDCAINITKSGDSSFLDYETSITIPVLKTKQAELIVEANPANLTYSGSSVVTATLSTTGGSGTGNVTYAVAAESASICSVTGNVVTVITGGDCVVIATKAGDINFAEATGSVTIKINKGDQAAIVVSAEKTSLQYVLGGTVQTGLTTTGGSGDGSVSYSVAPASAAICSLDGDNVVVIKTGDCVINATKASDPYFNEKTASVTITITKGVQPELVVTTEDATIQYSSTTVVRTLLIPTGGAGTGLVSYTVDSASLLVCALQGSKIVALRAGTCTINATKAGDSDFVPATDSVSIEITKGNQAELVLASEDATLAYIVNALVKTRLSVSGGSGTGAVTYSVAPASASVCSISGNTVTALTSGNCEVIATQASDTNFLETSDSLVITITKGLQAALSVTPAKSTLDYSRNGVVTTTVTATGGSGTSDITYAISPASSTICSISGKTVTAITGGDCVVVATKAGDVTFEPATATTTIKINKDNQVALVLSTASATLQYSENSKVQTELLVSGGSGEGDITYSVAPSSVGICAIEGINVVALSVGSCVIKATKASDVYFNEATATTTVIFSKANQAVLISSSDPAEPETPKWNGTKTTQVIISGGSGTGALSLTSLTPTICSIELIDQKAKVTGIAAGLCQFRINKESDPTFLAATPITHTLNVGSLSTDLKVTVSPAALNAGGTGTIELTVANLGPAAAAGASVDYTLPTGVSSGSPLGAGCVLVSNTLVRCSTTSVIPASGSVKFTLPVSIATSLVGGEKTSGGSVALASSTPDSETANNNLTGDQANFLINKAPTAFSKTTLLAMQTGSAFSDLLEAVGFPAVTYSVSAGTLPAGLSLNAETGAITGTPSGSGNYSFTITATNTVGSLSRVITGNIAPIPVVTVPGSGLAQNTVPVGTKVTISGTNLDLVTGATIGEKSANIASKSANQIVLDVPNGSAAGEVPISLIYAQGTLPAGTFRYTGVDKLNPVIVISAGASTAGAAEAARTLSASITAAGITGPVTLPVVYSSKTTSVCTVAGNQLSFLAVGLCTVSATSAATAVFNAGTASDVSIAVAKSDQVLTIVLPQNTVPPTKATDSADGFELVASASSALPVTFVSTTPLICDVTEEGFVTGIKPGVCIVKVSQAGNARFSPIAPTKMEFTITADSGGPTIDTGDPSKPTSLTGGQLSKLGDAGFSWDKNAGALKVEAYGVWIGKISAVSEFTISGKAYQCTVNFGILKKMPSKTAAQLKAAMAKKKFTSTTPFCNSKTEAAALAALKKGFNNLAVKVTITRFRMYPTTYKPINAKTKKKITTQIRTVYLTLG